jgi:dynein heavy chain 2
LDIQPILNLWKALNKGTNLIELSTVKNAADSNQQPIDVFVDQELNFAIRLVKNIHKSLAAINQAIRGNTRPSPTASDTVFHLLQLQVIAANYR